MKPIKYPIARIEALDASQRDWVLSMHANVLRRNDSPPSTGSPNVRLCLAIANANSTWLLGQAEQRRMKVHLGQMTSRQMEDEMNATIEQLQDNIPDAVKDRR